MTVKPQKHTTEFNDVKIEYNPAVLKSFIHSKKLAKAQKEHDDCAYFDYLDALLLGKSDDVAAKLGDDIETMSQLLEHIATISGEAKN